MATPEPIRPQPRRYKLPPLHDLQQQILVHPARHKVIVTGRQWGKTTLGAVMCLVDALKGGHVWWVGPTFPVAVHGWRVVLDLAGQVDGVEIDGRPMPAVRFPRELGGGRIEMHSSNDPHSLRGATLTGVVFDEAAFANPDAWAYLQPTLAIKHGWATFISTPNGQNWFFDIYREAANLEDWMTWRAPSVSNPWFPPDELERQRQTMSSLTFSQEYLAEFIAAGEAFFRAEWVQHYFAEVSGEERFYTLGNERVALSVCQKFHTVDLAWSQAEDADYTVISSWAVTPKRHLILLDVQRGHFEGPDIVPRMRRAYDKWGGVVIVERATRQMSIFQEAVRTGLPVREIRAEKDKEARSALAQARMEQRTVWFPPASTSWYPDIEEELLGFPASRHDDFVDTLSYAAIHISKGSRYNEGRDLRTV